MKKYVLYLRGFPRKEIHITTDTYYISDDNKIISEVMK